MTPKQSDFPPRVWLSVHAWNDGAKYGFAYRNPKFPDEPEYLSLTEHEALLREGRAEATEKAFLHAADTHPLGSIARSELKALANMAAREGAKNGDK